MPNDLRRGSPEALGFLVAPVSERPLLIKEENNRFPQAETRSSSRTSCLGCPARGQLRKAGQQGLPVSLRPGWAPLSHGSPAGSQVKSSSQDAGSSAPMPAPLWPLSAQGFGGTRSFFRSCRPRTRHLPRNPSGFPSLAAERLGGRPGSACRYLRAPRTPGRSPRLRPRPRRVSCSAPAPGGPPPPAYLPTPSIPPPRAAR